MVGGPGKTGNLKDTQSVSSGGQVPLQIIHEIISRIGSGGLLVNTSGNVVSIPIASQRE
jgi:hypothetical protein